MPQKQEEVCQKESKKKYKENEVVTMTMVDQEETRKRLSQQGRENEGLTHERRVRFIKGDIS